MNVEPQSDPIDLERVLQRLVRNASGDRDAVRPSIRHGNWTPRADVKIAKDEIVAYVDLPGVDEEEVAIEVLPDVLALHGRRGFDHDLEDAEEFVLLDRQYGPFTMELPLPVPIDPNRATPRYKRGVLRVRMPFADVAYRGHRVSA